MSRHAHVVQVSFVAAVFLAWHLCTVLGIVSPLFLPPLALVWAELVSVFTNGTIVEALATTLGTVLAAFAVAVVAGLACGFAISRSPFATRLLEPLLSAVFAIPLTLFFPLFLLFFGIGPESKLAYGATYAFFPIVINTVAGLRRVDAKLIASARSMGAPAHLLFRRVLFPGALPVILTGMRVGFFICFAAVLGGETLSSISGLGHQIATSAQLMESAKMFAWILIVIATASALVILAGLLERLRGDLRWERAS